jgi:processive 1,2-diacylglycerol beta-glucosyltransferase
MQNKRILLMYISEVSGHRSATMAIDKALKLVCPSVETLNINAFHYTNPISEKVVNRIYMSLIKKAPKVWDYLYDNPHIVKRVEKIKKAVHRFNSPKMKTLFDKFKPDIVVCSQAFPCGMVADYKATYHSTVKLIAVLTDHVPHAYWVYDTVDWYITPSPEVSHRLMKKGIPSNKIKELGIPFDPEFMKPSNKTEIYARLGLDAAIPTILIMGGGQGLGPIKTMMKSLEKIPFPLQEIIVTGTNKKLYVTLKKKAAKSKKKILLYGYTTLINEFMTISDMLITKPGGITTAEALAKQIPMVIVKPIPGQEANNTIYLTQQKAALKVNAPEELNTAIEHLLRDPTRLQNLRESAAKICKPSSSIDIAKFLLEL